ncbi:MAG: FkbM family methyltransferase [Geminicoccaceae bacterium]
MRRVLGAGNHLLASRWTEAKVTVWRLLSWLRQRCLGGFATAILAETPQGKFLVPSGDLMVGRHLSFRGAWGVDLLAILERHVSPEASVLIVGAHIGTMVVPLARQARRVVAIEPSAGTFSLLQANLWLNGLNNVDAHRIAAGSERRTVTIRSEPDNTGAARASLDSAGDDPVEMFPLDQHLNERFSLVLIDVEGLEASVLKGMPRLLASADTLVVEVIPNHLDHVAKLSLDGFFEAIPDRFTTFALISQPERWLNRTQAKAACERLYRDGYTTGDDLIASAVL